MSTHPLSLFKQVLYNFKEVIDARFYYENYSIILMVKLIENVDTKDIVSKIQTYLKAHASLTTQYIIELNWKDGPNYPVEFNNLDPYEFSLIEASSGTVKDITNLLFKVYDYIEKVYVHTKAPGHVEIGVQLKYQIEEEKINKLKLFCKLSPIPGVKVDVKTFLSYDKKSQNNYISKIKTNNSTIKRIFEEGEDLLRTAININYGYDAFEDKYQTNDEVSKILLPRLDKNINLKPIIPFYEKIFFYVPFSDKLSTDIDINLYGCSIAEIKELIENNKMVPIFSNDYSKYDENLVLSLVEHSKFISPQHLTNLVASDYVSQNPLWLVGQEDFLLVKSFLDNYRKEISSLQLDDYHLNFIQNWIDFQIDGIIDFSRIVINEGASAPLYFGSGAFLAKLWRELNSEKNSPELELSFAGLEIAYSSAIKANCYPSSIANFKTYEYLSSFHSQSFKSSSNELLLLKNLDVILKSIEIDIPENMSVFEWNSIIENTDILNLRKILKKYFQKASIADIDDIQNIGNNIAKELQSIKSTLKKYDFLISKIDILSVFIEIGLNINEVDPNVKTQNKKNLFDQAAFLYAISGVIPSSDECGLKELYFSI
jgi:hypothetical protein